MAYHESQIQNYGVRLMLISSHPTHEILLIVKAGEAWLKALRY